MKENNMSDELPPKLIVKRVNGKRNGYWEFRE